MKPGKKNIKLYRGATDRIGLTIRDKVTKIPINLSGSSISGSLYNDYTTFELPQNNLIVSPSEGKIVVIFSPESKNNLQGQAKWRIKITWANSEVWRIIEGDVELIS